MGIINLLSRIRIYYGEGAGWYFENRDGAVSELILPDKAEEAAESNTVGSGRIAQQAAAK